ncbi:siphovirus Gp157 family protein [Vibrio parahaemolyticus]|uniref:siphovirus Gp157 family protein n=3 Tax=Vibrio parahaemolyticus TaxID=670 RepID=UPI0015DE6BCC|nr:siphovirus Gp157 family protein [Vibrio parahaemolyticus]MCZ5859985.1 siphovirus Gp157 family protein [Vibrio parahaemolyticus]MCZ6278756.1 siphovirus Gp157 family protein [Vibrio parahaemolyticus]MDF4619785.1 siphovirus Gp157 family protein [Vibrio parahaemolyticus]MDF5494761.1 siphovirus Gp157 family protein [Vibrio parahaemolyticus]MDG3050148.1 siphovirus Gp157 family protein [Vibrio parahaemolyticus]
MDSKRESINIINQQVFDLLEQAKNEKWDEQTIADNLAGIECSIDDKLMAYRRYMDKLETAANLAESEKKVYADQAKPYGDRAKSLKDERSRLTFPLLNLFQMLNIEKMKGAYGTFYIKKNPDKLRYKESELPERFLIREVRFVPDEEKIKKALDDGEELDFAWYETQPKQVVLRK